MIGTLPIRGSSSSLLYTNKSFVHTAANFRNPPNSRVAEQFATSHPAPVLWASVNPNLRSVASD